MNKNKTSLNENQEGKENGVFHLGYDANDDIYNNAKYESETDPENINNKKTENEANQNEFSDEEMGGDLDVPGSELDDEQEIIGSEDEENNYYSLGLDNHNELEENREE